MRVEETELVSLGAAHGLSAEDARARLENGERLASSWWSAEVLSTGHAVLATEQLVDIGRCAEKQAALLWQRMADDGARALEE